MRSEMLMEQGVEGSGSKLAGFWSLGLDGGAIFQ